jgi:hypothetical protein
MVDKKILYDNNNCISPMANKKHAKTIYSDIKASNIDHLMDVKSQKKQSNK